MMQLLDLLLLATDLQGQVLHLEAVAGLAPLSERARRAVGRAGGGAGGAAGAVDRRRTQAGRAWSRWV